MKELVTFEDAEKVRLVKMDSGSHRLVVEHSDSCRDSFEVLQVTSQDILDIAEFREDDSTGVNRHITNLDRGEDL